MGDSLLEMAQQDPTANFLGIEVHRPGVGKLLHGITEHQVKNLKIICHDATEVIADCFPEQSIDNILVFFPDPWPKKRHHKRRIIQPGFVSLLSSRLKQGGHLHLATDWEQYAEHMMEVLEQETTLSNAFGKGKYYEDPARPQTKFENRGRRLGHGVWDLLFKRIG
jgi:tRNA (guanine-N7-)-methyltransferase